jgi:hypothetical protein
VPLNNLSKEDLAKIYIEYANKALEKTQESGLVVCKALLNVNGAAIIALLTFMGNIISKVDAHDVIPFFTQSLKYFLYGLTAAVFTIAVRYFNCLSHNFIANLGLEGKKSPILDKADSVIIPLGIIGGIASLIFFCFGVHYSILAFERF